MGWMDGHMHQFVAGTKTYGRVDSEFSEWENEKKVRLVQVLRKPKDSLVYEYDFGDGWAHAVVLEQVLEMEPGGKYPYVVEGKRACPPEDCGGTGGYEHLIEVLADPRHPEHADMAEWVGGSFDPEAFDAGEINRRPAKRPASGTALLPSVWEEPGCESDVRGSRILATGAVAACPGVRCAIPEEPTMSCSPSRFLRTVVITAAWLAAPLPAFAAWPNSAYTGLPVCVATPANKLDCMAVSDGAGGAIFVWKDNRFGTFDIFAQHVTASGAMDPNWPYLGLAVCTAAGDQGYPVLVTDGAGGAIVAWQDARNGLSNWDVYAQHVLASGTVDPAWPVDGTAVCTAANQQFAPTLVSDTHGGAIVTWADLRGGSNSDIYAQRVQANGVVDPTWPANGQLICGAANAQSSPTITTDGYDGAIITWQDGRGANQDIYAQHVYVTSLIDPSWPVNGIAVCTAAQDQSEPVIVADGNHGAIVAWIDFRNGATFNVYAQHVIPGGTTDPGWLANGSLLGAPAGNNEYPVIASDGLGGAFVAWMNTGSAPNWKVYAQHVLPAGALDAGYPASGLAASGATGDQENPMIVADGLGGTFLVWQDLRAGTNWDLYGQHLLPGVGLDATFWPSNGKAISLAAGNQLSEGAWSTAFSSLASDGAGGLIAGWQDTRASSNADIYAERVARFGYIGTPEAEIVGVTDVPNDNGGKVKLSWNASYLDQNSDPNLAAYDVLRSVPAAAALARLQRGARLASGLAQAASPEADQLFVTRANGQNYYWEYLASVNALHYVSGYSYVAPTTGDSTGAGNRLTAFMVVARNANGSLYWPSRPDSGYSVDNLPPAVPAPFAARYASGATHLSWGANTEPDLAGYRLYRGSSAEFVPSPGNRIAAQSDTGYADVGAAGSYYKLSAIDVHGNESGFALVGPGTTLNAGGGAPGVLAFAPISPNPLSSTTVLQFSVPRAARVNLAAYDATGRRVRELVSAVEPAGAHGLAWDLRDDSGRAVGAGMYFLRLEAEGRELTQRMVVLR